MKGWIFVGASSPNYEQPAGEPRARGLVCWECATCGMRDWSVVYTTITEPSRCRQCHPQPNFRCVIVFLEQA